MFNNAVYIGGPKVNWVPRILINVADCMSCGEEYCFFCIQSDEEKEIKGLEKKLRGYGYDVEIFVFQESLEVDGEDDVISLYYIKVMWDNFKMGRVVKMKTGGYLQ